MALEKGVKDWTGWFGWLKYFVVETVLGGELVGGKLVRPCESSKWDSKMGVRVGVGVVCLAGAHEGIWMDCSSVKCGMRVRCQTTTEGLCLHMIGADHKS